MKKEIQVIILFASLFVLLGILQMAVDKVKSSLKPPQQSVEVKEAPKRNDPYRGMNYREIKEKRRMEEEQDAIRWELYQRRGF